MKSIKKLMFMNYNYYKEIEQKLEDYAKKGLLLEKTGSFFWTFKKTEPQNLKYTLTYFTESSVFNPHPTDNQQTYFEYAKAAGWDFICEYGKMQIFSSSLENPTAFETDEKEKLDNIHNCMKKSFVISQILMILVFLLNLFLRLSSLKRHPADFLSSNLDLATLLMFSIIILYSCYGLINYYSWYNKSKKSIAIGGAIINNFNKSRKYFDIIYLVLLFLIVGYMFTNLFISAPFGIIALSIAQLPLFALVFWGSIKVLKKCKISAKLNKIISISVLILTCVLYLGFIFYSISHFDFNEKPNKPHTTVDWEMYDGVTREYHIYSDTLPITCEDLYENIDFKYYSYEKDESHTHFLNKTYYAQTCPPMKDAPPELEYTIYKTAFEFVQKIVVSDLINIEDWSDRKLETLDNSIFSTETAYTFYYENQNQKMFSGEYVLVFSDKIIHIYAETPLTNDQIEIIKHKLII